MRHEDEKRYIVLIEHCKFNNGLLALNPVKHVHIDNAITDYDGFFRVRLLLTFGR